MTFHASRREFLSGLGMMTAAAALPSIPGQASMNSPMKSPFRIAVINDEIGQDFGRVCEVASQEFGMEWIELRGTWNKNLLKLDAKEIEEARRILEKNKLRVTDIASPLFKVDWPGAPKSKYSPSAINSTLTLLLSSRMKCLNEVSSWQSISNRSCPFLRFLASR